jgi:hypothetical protein
MTKRNPKQEGTSLYDCTPQAGKCPIGCNQCFFNRPGAFYTDTPSVPTPEEIGDGIVRMNCGADSNIQRYLVIATAKQYKDVFFNTSIPVFDFPGPVVFTANAKEEEPAYLPFKCIETYGSVPKNLMFVRLRVSGTNIYYIDEAVQAWTLHQVPVVLTFMAYYDKKPKISEDVYYYIGDVDFCYEWRVRHINSYWCPTKAFLRYVLDRYQHNRLVSMCGSVDVGYCRACRNCETYYLQTAKRLRGE